MAEHRIFSTAFSDVYPHYVTKAEKKDRTKEEVDEIIGWLTGYSSAQLESIIDDGTTFKEFFGGAPALNPARKLITGSICGIKIQDIEDPLMQNIRYLDKLIDELARGKALDKIKRLAESTTNK